MNSIECTRCHCLIRNAQSPCPRCTAVSVPPPIPSPSYSAPIKQKGVKDKVVKNDDADAPLFAQLLAGILPIVGFFMAGLVYGRSPKRCMQIWEITLKSFVIQFLILFGAIVLMVVNELSKC